MSDLYEVAMMVKEAAEAEYESDLSKTARNEWSRTGSVNRRAIKAPAQSMQALAPQSMEALVNPVPRSSNAIITSYPMEQAARQAPNAIITSYPMEQAASQAPNAIITTRPSTKMETLQAYARNIKHDAADVVESARKGKTTGYGLRAAGYFAKAHKGLVGGVGLAAATGLGALAYSKHETGAAKTAAELMYQEAMAEADEVNEKIAFAQQLFEDAEYEEKIASETSNAIITTRPSTKMETLQAYARNIKHDAADVVESARKGKTTGYGIRAAKTFAKAHPAALAAGALAAGALTAGGAYAYNSRAKTAAELIYNEAMADAEEINEKIAFAQQLFDEADYAEKLAEDNGSGTAVPYAASAGYGAAAGAAVGGVAGSALMGLNYHLNHVAQDPRAIAVGGAAGAAVGSVIGAAAAPLAQAGIAGVGALKAFVDEHRAQRAAQNVQG